MTLEEALAYLTPHPHTNGPVQLTPSKMREAIGAIRAALPVRAAPFYDESAHYREAWTRLANVPGVHRTELAPAFGAKPLWQSEHVRCKAWVEGIAQAFMAIEKSPAFAIESVIRKIEKSRSA